MYCGRCGLKLPDNIKRCSRCGALINENESDNAIDYVELDTRSSHYNRLSGKVAGWVKYGLIFLFIITIMSSLYSVYEEAENDKKVAQMQMYLAEGNVDAAYMLLNEDGEVKESDKNVYKIFYDYYLNNGETDKAVDIELKYLVCFEERLKDIPEEELNLLKNLKEKVSVDTNCKIDNLLASVNQVHQNENIIITKQEEKKIDSEELVVKEEQLEETETTISKNVHQEEVDNVQNRENILNADSKNDEESFVGQLTEKIITKPENALLSYLKAAPYHYAKEKNITLYSFSEEKKIIKWLNDTKGEGLEEFIYLDTEGNGFKRSLKGNFIYIGELKDNKPDGIGMIIDVQETIQAFRLKYAKDHNEWSDMQQYAELIESKIKSSIKVLKDGNYKDSLNTFNYIKITYIGEFKDGAFDGYGLVIDTLVNPFLKDSDTVLENTEYQNFVNEDAWAFNFVKTEGMFKKGKKEGKINHFATGGIIIKEIIENEVSWNIYVGKYLPHGIFSGEKYNGKIYSSGFLLYDGEVIDGLYDGKGKEYYYLSSQIKYNGEYKDGKYNGKGTLYNPDGSVKYSGEWKNGDYK